MEISVVLNTCDRADSLSLSLLALMRQTHKEHEVIIVDDGSTDHTPEVIEDARLKASFPIAHIWQERDGHSRTILLNEGIKAARYDYIFFTDCDVLAREDVLEAHARHCSADRFLLGSMVRMSKEYTRSITPEIVESGAFAEYLTAKRRKKLLRQIRKAKMQTFFRVKGEPHIYGTNFSVGKEALLRVNGYDENFRGWGNADGDLRERLKMVGLRPMPIYEEAIVFHMAHPRHPTASLRLNRDYARRRNIPARCLNGIEKLRENDRTE